MTFGHQYCYRFYSLLLLFLVSVRDIFGDLFELRAVAGFDVGPSLEEVLDLRDDRLLGVQSPIQTLQLLIQLNANV